mgnify:CR=1 FL=1
MKMTEEYRRTLDEDKRERAMERELGIKHPIPVEHRFVVITEEPTATIASDLSKYIKTEVK